MEKEAIIRRAITTDTTAIENIARRTWQSTYSGIIRPENQELLLRRNYAPDALEKAILQKDSWFFIASVQSEPVGFVQFIMREGEGRDGELSRIYVLPEYQRHGAGGYLLREGSAALAKEGVERLFVVVEKDNFIGRTFYEKKGFHWVREFMFELPNQSLALVEYTLDELVRAG
jgi:ribosomal protein S18 acetylase RimI-like enzyme